MSKTTIFTIITALFAGLGSVAAALHLTINPVGVGATIIAVLTYLFGAFKTDLAGLANPAIWGDPKTYLTALNVIMGSLTTASILSPELGAGIMAVLTFVVGLLFKPKQVVAALRRVNAARLRAGLHRF